ncbi:glycosyltransferase family 4 protein [Candidatus Kaiserbacteria bacterium]|nr:glycosyltransferase family 4 protein [Candidatus Kaiserbacteria bacterium]
MTKKPSILVVVPYGFNDRLINFPEFTLSRLLAKHDWHVRGLTRREDGESLYETTHGIDVYRYGATLRGTLRLLQLLLFERPDIIHVHMLRNNRVGALAALLSKIFRIALVFSEAGLLHDHYLVDDRDDPLGKPVHYERVARHPWQGIRSYLFHFAFTHADTAVFYSKHNVPIAKRLGARNVHYIPLIVDDARQRASEVRDRGSRPLPEEPFGLFVGQMKERKGWDVLLRAIALTPRETVPKFVFVSSSAATEPDAFAKLVDTLGVRDRIQFLGQASNAELQSAFERASLVVVPSRYEGFGLVPLEAFETGKPVIASRVEALTDYLVHEENVLLVPPDDPERLAECIVQLALDEKLRTRIIDGGVRTRAEMESDAGTLKWLNFYQQLIAKG